MTDEEKELLARIGQLAGQINRHKNQQAGYQSVPPSHHPSRHRGNVYRQASAPYPTRGFSSRPAAAHRHRTLHLNASASASGSASSSAAPSPAPTGSGWVSKNDRHRQLINASIYEKDSQNRAKAIEETRQRKLREQRLREKKRFGEYLRRQAGAAGFPNSGMTANATGTNEISVNGIQFRVLEGGKKLVKAPGDPASPAMTPKSTVIAGVKFHRTKTGNLVAQSIVKDQRRSGAVKKLDQRCKIFSTTGSCPKGPTCRYIHDPNKVALCKDFMKDGKCPNGEACDLSHELTPERVPNCLHFAKGQCSRPDCPFTHSKAPPSAPVCEAFGFCGYCDKGADCTNRHVFECPNFSNTGSCNIRGCKLLHRERASVLRNQAKQREEAENKDEDLSSDDESVDSDDVDSDEVAEFLEADSDDSDFENPKDFLPL
ncbi:hypothetical protein M440DRAFT_1398841 [Trichoderma longibrachiatum ATCC 18648]|uniref:C3H1-type domain-containing protein n=1 Tax=Trichoderma longibrachiatum ATCC 18648 TaxID=983965 RepID=A0A2T4CDD8_TRILO|nr:hypothetical protein M440DRAFT_1398841 [Trichoderma longibrachiatum ATCC 18648]